MQDLDDGLYHDEDETAETICLGINSVIRIEWSTSAALKLGDDCNPALVIHTSQPASTSRSESTVSVGDHIQAVTCSKRQTLR